MQFKDAKVSFKAGPEEGLEEGEFFVYPSTFIREPDAYGDVVAKGAFAESIKEWADSGNVLPGLYGHRLDDPDYFVASAIEMGEDDHGWWVKGKFDLDSPKGAQTYRLVKGKRLTKLSFAYDIVEESPVELADGLKANELRKLHVHEFSFVPVPANPDATVMAVKDAVGALAATAKAGRAISAKNEATIKAARTSLAEGIDALDDVLSVLGQGNDQEKQASGNAEAKSDASADASAPVSDSEPKSNPSVGAWRSMFNTYATVYGGSQEGDQS